MTAQKPDEFRFETAPPMVILLTADVFDGSLNPGDANREGSVTLLPAELRASGEKKPPE